MYLFIFLVYFENGDARKTVEIEANNSNEAFEQCLREAVEEINLTKIQLVYREDREN